jgi:hypothetical protein
MAAVLTIAVDFVKFDNDHLLERCLGEAQESTII